MSKQCEQIKENGDRCKSFAMYQRDYCYYHWRLLANKVAVTEPAYEPPSLDSEAGVQLAATQIFRSLAAGKIEPYRAQTMLASLKVIASSLRANEELPDNIARELTPAMEKQLATHNPPPPLPGKKGPASVEELFHSEKREVV